MVPGSITFFPDFKYIVGISQIVNFFFIWPIREHEFKSIHVNDVLGF